MGMMSQIRKTSIPSEGEQGSVLKKITYDRCVFATKDMVFAIGEKGVSGMGISAGIMGVFFMGISGNWKERSTILKFGKPSISMGHCHRYLR